MRILWVVPRYGRGIAGGAETHVRALATRCAAEGWSAEVAATCARDHVTWADELPEGTAVEDGVPVHRFRVGPRDGRRYEALHAAIMSGRAGYADELEWLANSVWSPGMQEFLEDEPGHDLRVLSPYLFGTTLWGAQAAPERSALMPCLHDEPYARLTTVRRVMGAVRGALFNAPAEERLARRIAPVRDGGVVGMGFDPPEGPPGPVPGAIRGLGPYLVYAGRLEEGKRVQLAVDHVVRLAGERPGGPALVLMGRGGYRPPPSARGRVVELGYVSEGEKRAVYAGATALVNPSELESLSIVLMEAWLEGTPAIVAAGSEVMSDHVARSGGGMTFGSYEEFRAAAGRLLDNPGERERMGARGRAYALEEYSWPAVWERLAAVAERLAA
ncbi:MAG TPA: glycosyltransferase [Miltoncostaeaceae bacterium]|nr:glycosyltransferase [Miltoncostaeaceae bacterium]